MSSFPFTVPPEHHNLLQQGASWKQHPAVLGAEDVLLTFKEAMGYLRVSRSTLYRLMWSGKLPGHKVGGTWRFYQQELRACICDQEFPRTNNAERKEEAHA